MVLLFLHTQGLLPLFLNVEAGTIAAELSERDAPAGMAIFVVIVARIGLKTHFVSSSTRCTRLILHRGSQLMRLNG